MLKRSQIGWVGRLEPCALVFTTENQPQAIRERQVPHIPCVPCGSETIFGQLQQYATLMGISESELATDLLKTIVQDDLCEAVLDRDATEVAKAA